MVGQDRTLASDEWARMDVVTGVARTDIGMRRGHAALSDDRTIKLSTDNQTI